MAKWLPYLLVGVGGCVGANARYLVARWVGSWFEARFPLATFLINISGSFLLGAIGWVVSQRLIPNGDHWRLALGVGFLGAYTTFSTFEYETHALFEDGVWLTALANIVLSVLVGLLAVRAGIVAARWWFVS
jgi:CrcB protein